MIGYILLSVCLQSMIGCKEAQPENAGGVFEYREIYLPERNTEEAKLLKLNNVDNDWGIWGHHMNVVLPKNPSNAVFATIGGRANTDQFCFSSDRLYNYIVDYIDDHFGTNKTHRFAILPNDNDIVCQCKECVDKGCTSRNASPAVLSMIERLAQRFPKHIFFTSYYLTTSSLPKKPMPENTGVLISAFDYPISAKYSPEEMSFEKLLMKWKQVTSRIYIWDYINNFDDYFTPCPIFSAMQRRFQLYAKSGVTGVFLNGSGNDYCSFSRLKTHVLSAMMINPEVNWKELLREKCSDFYPVTGQLIADYLIKQEEDFEQSGKIIPLYQGVAVAKKTYLNDIDFITFHKQLVKKLHLTEGEEKEEITQLVYSMMMTRLELERLKGSTSEANSMLNYLSHVKDYGTRIYSESFWTVDSYINDYTAMVNEAENRKKKDLLLGLQLIPLTALDEEYTDVSILTDGLTGLPSNYHCGQLISSADPALKIAIPRVEGMKHLRVGMTHNVQFHIAYPLRITLSANGQEIGSIEPPQQSGISGRTSVEFEIPSSSSGTLILTIVRNQEERTMAIDEIEGW